MFYCSGIVVCHVEMAEKEGVLVRTLVVSDKAIFLFVL